MHELYWFRHSMVMFFCSPMVLGKSQGRGGFILQKILHNRAIVFPVPEGAYMDQESLISEHMLEYKNSQINSASSKPAGIWNSRQQSRQCCPLVRCVHVGSRSATWSKVKWTTLHSSLGMQAGHLLYSPDFSIFSRVTHFPLTSFSLWSILSFTTLQRTLNSAW